MILAALASSPSPAPALSRVVSSWVVVTRRLSLEGKWAGIQSWWRPGSCSSRGSSRLARPVVAALLTPLLTPARAMMKGIVATLTSRGLLTTELTSSEWSAV